MASSNQKVVLITGCSSGIGLSTAVVLAKDPKKRFKVYATMRNLRKKEALETEGKEVLGSTLLIEQLDVCSQDQINKVVDDILSKEGKLDVLVNNAGIGWFGPTERHENASIESMYATNVFGPIKLIKKLLPVWKKCGTGHAITVTSIAGIIGFPFNSAYVSTKFAMEGFMEAVQLELHNYPNIKMSTIEPGPVETKMAENVNIRGIGTTVDGLDEPTMNLLTNMFKFMSLEASKAISQQGEDIANVILEAITSSNPHARYMTNPNFSDMLKIRYPDLTGDDVRKALGDFYFKSQ